MFQIIFYFKCDWSGELIGILLFVYSCVKKWPHRTINRTAYSSIDISFSFWRKKVTFQLHNLILKRNQMENSIGTFTSILLTYTTITIKKKLNKKINKNWICQENKCSNNLLAPYLSLSTKHYKIYFSTG